MNAKNGYLINLYQYAKRYRYNGKKSLEYFNYIVDRRNKLGHDPYTLDDEYFTFGEFDILQIIAVDSFRKYHDVSELAKGWLGKRQSVLLYDISTEEVPVRLWFHEKDRQWRKPDEQEEEKKFFCLSMLSLTNEIIEETDDMLSLQRMLRSKILSIVDQLNDKNACCLECEVFGTFNASELGIVWLSDQYVDILQTVDYIKHIKVKKTMADLASVQEHPAFFGSFSTIAIKQTSDPEGVVGDALIQIAVHDIVTDYGELQKIAKEIVAGDSSEFKEIRYSVGEYDIVLSVSARYAVQLFHSNETGFLCLGKRDKEGKFEIEDRKILRSNIRLLYREEHTKELKDVLDAMYAAGQFALQWDRHFKKFDYEFEWEELKYSGDDLKKTDDWTLSSNARYYDDVRKKLKERVSKSAGAVDTLDLMYTDYNSAISTAYSALWVSDLHRQFKSVLNAINLLLSSSAMEWSWDRFLDLTNAFKQQIFHLTQSNRMFFETPICHLRATGQYDFLMHVYYGITKRILEVIYRIQGEDAQSELVPLITVNTVPQVRTQMYFEVGDSNSRMINLDIPNTIIFDFQRGIWYLTHELFHYAVPWNRKERNYYMGIFLLSMIFKRQFLCLLKQMLSVEMDGTVDPVVEKAVLHLFADGKEKYSVREAVEFYRELDVAVLSCIEKNFRTNIQPYLKCSENALSSGYQLAVFQFSQDVSSERFYEKIFMELLPICNIFLEVNESECKDRAGIVRVKDRIRYCMRNVGSDEYVRKFLRSNMRLRAIDSKLNKYNEIVKNYWSAVREACSDIAMVSLNGLILNDYMLFCIQAWTDSGKDARSVPEKMGKLSSEMEWIRYAFVSEYFYQRNQKGWNGDCYMDEDTLVVAQDIRSEFLKQYVWFYADKGMKRPCDNLDKVKTSFSKLYDSADRWLDFFSQARRYYLKHLSFYFSILETILKDFDINRRLEKVCFQKRSCDVSKVKDICKGFQEEVKKKYTDLFADMPVDIRDLIMVSENKESISGLNESYKNLRFIRDISTAHFFRKQKSLKELGELNQEIRHTVEKCESVHFSLRVDMPEGSKLEKNDGKDLCWKFHVYSLTELLFYIKYCTKKLKEDSETDKYSTGQRNATPIWFRGHSHIKNYYHLPTVMRNYKGDKMVRFPSLRSFQYNNFEEFKFRADGVEEMPKGVPFTKSDYIAMMRHYDVSTNFLDWTENAFTSLYFALRPYFENADSEQFSRDNRTLSIFHPGIYNHIRKECLNLLKKNEESVKDLNSIFTKVLDVENRYTSLIPNLSIKENEERLDMFLFGDVRADAFFADTEKNSESYGKYLDTNDKMISDLFMPMAVLTSRLTPRIRTQCGCFVAYNLYTPPNPEIDDNPFKYISLEEIQDRKKEQGIFMYQIILDESCCLEVVDWLKSIGISQESVYPELSEKIIRLIENRK